MTELYCLKKIIKKSIKNNIPKGGIIMWSGSINSIPKGWLLCNGQNNTPNLQDKFILGYGQNNIGLTGGTSQIILQPENLPPHNHQYDTSRSVDITQEVGTADPIIVTNSRSVLETTFTGNGIGSSIPINIIPPYYVLAFIIKK